MRFVWFLCTCLCLTGCMKISDLKNDDQETETDQKAPVILEDDTKDHVYKCTNDAEEEITFVSKGDKITNMTQVLCLSFSDLGITADMDQTQIQSRLNASFDEKYNDLEGVEVSSELYEEKVEVTIEINFEAADIQSLIDRGLIQKGEVESNYVSLKKSKKDFEASGYACVAQ